MNLPKDLQQFVGEQLLLGNYDSLDDLVADALTLLRDKRQAEWFEAIVLGRRQIENGERITLRTKGEIHEYFEGITHGQSQRRPDQPS